jgi:very-short-patch-repair endonuclease
MRREFHVDRAIRGERETRAANAVIATLATRQHGVVSRDQLRAVGLGDDSIDRLIQAKRLHPLHRSVYAVGHRRLSREGRYLAAVLASGEGAVLSHRSAADLWELRATKEPEIDVIAPTHRRGDPAIEVHAHAMEHTETTTREAIRVTKPLRTLLDLAACVDEKELERAIRQAVYHRLTTTTLLAEAVHERRGHRGMKTMRKALIHAGEAPGRTRSELEDDFLHFLRKHRLPMPELNVKMRIRGRPIEADCVWREKRLIVELDGRDAHDSTPAFESDRARDSALAAATWCVVRVTSARMSTDGRRLARELRTLLA